jgi:hypothetical protein
VDPWTIGIIVVLAIGVAVILYGAMSDRRRNRRAAAEMLSPPDRAIPHFAPQTPWPNYLSELQARRAPTTARTPGLSPAQREEISREFDAPTTVRVEVGMASLDFVTDKSATWAVLDDPYVLVCAEPVATIREILTVLEKVLPTGHPLVIVAPALLGEVRSTLEVNAIQQTMALLGVLAEGDDLATIIRATSATPIPRTDLLSSYVSLDRLGRCQRWVSTPTTSYALRAAAPPGDAADLSDTDGHNSGTYSAERKSTGRKSSERKSADRKSSDSERFTP